MQKFKWTFSTITDVFPSEESKCMWTHSKDAIFLSRKISVTIETFRISFCVSDVFPQVCPKCKNPISRNRRYSNIIKQRYEAVFEIKRRTFGEKKYIDCGRNKHFQRLRAFKNSIRNYSMTNQRFLSQLQPRQGIRIFAQIFLWKISL